MRRDISLQHLLLRGLLFTVVLSVIFVSCAEAITLKIIIQPKQYKEFAISVNGITKITVNQEVTFDVTEGKQEIIVGNKKTIKEITRDSKVQIYYTDN